MRVLVSSIPGLGHFHPMVPLCRALERAGHEVLVGAPASFLPVVERCGLRGAAVRPDWLEQEAEAAFPGFTDAGAGGQVRCFTLPPERGLVEDLVQLGGAFEADLVLHDHLELGGWLAAELLGVPHVPFAMTTRLLDPPLVEAVFGDRVDELLAHFGLPPDPDHVRPSRWLYLDSMPPSLAGALLPPGPTVRPVRYEAEDRSGDERLPLGLLTGGRPLVHVTVGTVFNQVPGLLRTLALGAAALDVDVLVTSGRNLDPAALGRLPAHVRVERYVPQRDLLPHVAAVVCHGGFNTVFSALSTGTPLVVVPISADQPLNAQLCCDAGVAVRVTTAVADGVGPVARAHELEPAQVAQALRTVLEDRSYRRAAARLRDEIDRQPPVDRAVELLQALV